MKRIIVAALMSAALPAAAFAQMAPAGSHNPALKSPAVRTTTMAANGRNSFTETQAQGRIAKAGYTGIGKLAKTDAGVWQGKAMKNGKPVMVALDFKGDVTAH